MGDRLAGDVVREPHGLDVRDDQIRGCEGVERAGLPGGCRQGQKAQGPVKHRRAHRPAAYTAFHRDTPARILPAGVGESYTWPRAGIALAANPGLTA